MKRIFFLSVFILCSCVQQPNLSENMDTADLAIEVGALDRALILIQERAQEKPNNPAIRFQLANIYHKLGRYDMEKIELDALQKMVVPDSPDQQKLLIEMMRNSLYLANYEQVIDDYHKLQQHPGELSAKLQGISLTHVAIAYCKQSDYVSCLDYFEQAKAYLPGNSNLVQNIRLAEWMQVYQINQQSLGSEPFYRAYQETGTPQMFSNLVLSLINEGKEEQAFEVLSTRFSAQESLEIINDLSKVGL